MTGRRDAVLATADAIVFPASVVMAVYFLFAGHNQPGGGFVGGLVAGAGLALRALDSGPSTVRRLVGLEPLTIVGLGLTLAAVTGLVSLTLGEPYLTSGIYSGSLPLLGKVKLTSAFFFDSGVFLVVIGLVAGILVTLLPREDDRA